MKDVLHLRDFIDVDMLQEIQDKFADATGLAAVTVDYRGEPITRYSNFSRFCRLIRKDKKCKEACYQSDAHGGLEAARAGKPYIYKCHAGLVDFAIPIIVKGYYMGSIMSGQAKIEREKEALLENVFSSVPGWRNEREIIEAYNEIDIIPYDKVVAAAHMMFIISNYIVEKEVVTLVQEELNKKNIKLMEEMKARSELEKALMNSEFKALQAQINPHFLFNVLNTIGRLALIENADRTQEMIYNLAEMLRYTLKRDTNRKVHLEEEINHIERYLKIQSIRLGKRLKYSIKIPEDMQKIKIPFMTIQPLVENSIKHGIEPKEEGGSVTISGYSIGKDVIINIFDDGVGIPEGKLNSILQGKKNLDNDKSIGIGINNVNKRLVYCFGSNYGVKISSNKDGTSVNILLPKE